MTTLSPFDRDVLRRTDYRCHRCWTPVGRSPGGSAWHAHPVTAKARGGQGRVAHWLPVCSPCRDGRAVVVRVAQAPRTDWEELALLGGMAGLGAGWLVGGPVLALCGLAVGVVGGWHRAGKLG